MQCNQRYTYKSTQRLSREFRRQGGYASRVAKDVTRLPLFNLKSYVLQDDSGEATILTERELPKMNEEIRVKVKVGNLAIINGESLGTTFVEVERH